MLGFTEITNVIICTPDDRLILTKANKHCFDWSLTLETITSESRPIEDVVLEEKAFVRLNGPAVGAQVRRSEQLHPQGPLTECRRRHQNDDRPDGYA